MDPITHYIIIEQYIICIVALIVSIYFIFRIYKLIFDKMSMFDVKKADIRLQDSMKKNEKKINVFITFIMLIWIAMALWISAVSFPDLPNVIANKYITTECITTDDNYVDKNDRSLYCNDGNKEIYISYRGPNILKNTRIKINYFRHLEIGRIVAIESKEPTEDMN